MTPADREKQLEILAEVGPRALTTTREIAAYANTKPEGEVHVWAGIEASLVFENMMISIAAAGHAPGSEEGLAFLREMYDQALGDAVARWTKQCAEIAESLAQQRRIH